MTVIGARELGSSEFNLEVKPDVGKLTDAAGSLGVATLGVGNDCRANGAMEIDRPSVVFSVTDFS
jgi:hypothetical protein